MTLKQLEKACKKARESGSTDESTVFLNNVSGDDVPLQTFSPTEVFTQPVYDIRVDGFIIAVSNPIE